LFSNISEKIGGNKISRLGLLGSEGVNVRHLEHVGKDQVPAHTQKEKKKKKKLRKK